MKTLLTIKTSRGNIIEFNQFDHLGNNTLIVTDLSCQLERAYYLGEKGETVQGEEKTIINSFDDVIHAWKNEKVWF